MKKAKLVITSDRKYLEYLQNHLGKEHKKTKGKTKLMKI